MSAQQDRFVHDRLAAPRAVARTALRPARIPVSGRLNLVEELLDKAQAKGFGDRPAAAVQPDHPELHAMCAIVSIASAAC